MPPEVPTERLVELRVQSTLTGSQPIAVRFNAGFNALIGGRGSGKSSLLEYLRFGLGRTETDLGTQETGPKSKREVDLVDETLAEGFVEVTLEREGVTETWRRQLATREQITVTDNSGNISAQLSPASAQERFRARAFYQKELSTTAANPEQAADQITGIAAAEAVTKRRALDTAIKNAKRELTTLLQRLVAFWQADFEAAQAKARVNDLHARVDSSARRLLESGMDANQLAIIEGWPRYSRAASFLEGVRRILDEAKDHIQIAADDFREVSLEAFPSVVEFEEIKQVVDTTERVRGDVQSLLKNAVDMINELLDGLVKTSAASFGERMKAFEVSYLRACPQVSAEGQRPRRSGCRAHGMVGKGGAAVPAA